MNKKTLLVLLALFCLSSFSSGNEQHHEGKRPKPRMPSFLFTLSKLSEEERDELFTLYQKDKEAFRIELEKRSEENRRHFREKMAYQNKLAMAYQSAPDEKAKEEAFAALQNEIKREYEERLRMSEHHLKEAEKRVIDIREDYQQRVENADKIIEARINHVIKRAQKAAQTATE